MMCNYPGTFPSRAFASTLLAFLLVALAPGAALAVEPRPGEVITIGPNETINDDLYAFGRTVDVLGMIRGDVVAFAGVVTIAGRVTGDVIAAGGQVRVTGEVSGSVRASGGDVSVDGRVGEDVVVGAGNLTLGPQATVGRDVYAGGGAVLVNGRVGRNVQVGGGEVTIGGQVGGNVDAEVGRLQVSPGTTVQGQLRYTSDNEAQIAPDASVRGGVQRRVPERRQDDRASNPALDIFIGWLRSLVGLFLLGFIIELLSPGLGRRTMITLSRSPATSILLGTVLFLLVPVAALVIFGLGLLVGGWWIALIVLAGYAIALICSVALAGMSIGRWLLNRLGRPGAHFAWALLLGVVILTLVGLVPVAGGVLVGLLTLVAFGALVLTTVRRPASEVVGSVEAP